jgi:hypothetical protein
MTSPNPSAMRLQILKNHLHEIKFVNNQKKNLQDSVVV